MASAKEPAQAPEASAVSRLGIRNRDELGAYPWNPTTTGSRHRPTQGYGLLWCCPTVTIRHDAAGHMHTVSVPSCTRLVGCTSSSSALELPACCLSRRSSAERLARCGSCPPAATTASPRAAASSPSGASSNSAAASDTLPSITTRSLSPCSLAEGSMMYPSRRRRPAARSTSRLSYSSTAKAAVCSARSI